MFEWGSWRRWGQLLLSCLSCGRGRQPWLVLLRWLPVDGIWIIAEGWHCLERRVKSWLRRLELQCLLGRPAGVRYEFGILFGFHSFECPFLFRTLISSVASIFPMKVTEQFMQALRRSAASASSFPSAPVGPAPLMVFFGVVIVLPFMG